MRYTADTIQSQVWNRILSLDAQQLVILDVGSKISSIRSLLMMLTEPLPFDQVWPKIPPPPPPIMVGGVSVPQADGMTPIRECRSAFENAYTQHYLQPRSRFNSTAELVSWSSANIKHDLDTARLMAPNFVWENH